MKVFDDTNMGGELQVVIDGYQYSMEYDRYCDSLFLWREDNNKSYEISIENCMMHDKFESSGMNTMTVDSMSDGSWGGHTTYERGVDISEISIPLHWYKEIIEANRVDGVWCKNVEQNVHEF